MDGNYVFSASISLTKGSSAYSHPALFKLDPAGNLMWVKKYGPTGSNTGLMMVKELPDSSLIAVGRKVIGVTMFGLMVHADKNGDSLFVATYENDSSGTNNQNYLWDVVQMPDKGFMAVGEVIGLPPSSTYRQDAWVIRVDSNGCILSNCSVGIKNLEFSKKTIDVYPNPSTGNINIDSEEEIKRISIYDLQGRVLKQIRGNQSQLELPTATGLYLLKISLENGNNINKKVLKQ